MAAEQELRQQAAQEILQLREHTRKVKGSLAGMQLEVQQELAGVREAVQVANEDISALRELTRKAHEDVAEMRKAGEEARQAKRERRDHNNKQHEEMRRMEQERLEMEAYRRLPDRAPGTMTRPPRLSSKKQVLQPPRGAGSSCPDLGNFRPPSPERPLSTRAWQTR